MHLGNKRNEHSKRGSSHLTTLSVDGCSVRCLVVPKMNKHNDTFEGKDGYLVDYISETREAVRLR